MHTIIVQTPWVRMVDGTPFPVRRIWCVGQNYADHAREVGGDPDRAAPFFFAKHADSVVESGGTLDFPRQTDLLHHEVELVVAIGRGGRDVAPDAALALVYGYAVGLDMTRRDLQAEAKRLGRPWELAKSFDQSCPIGALMPTSRIDHPTAGAITLTVNGEVRQSGDLSQMIWPVSDAIAFLSRYVTLLPGDLIMTGTPAGVGPVQPGDRLVGTCAGVGTVEITYRDARS